MQDVYYTFLAARELEGRGKCLHCSDGATRPILHSPSQCSLRKTSVSDHDLVTYGKHRSVHYTASRQGR